MHFRHAEGHGAAATNDDDVAGLDAAGGCGIGDAFGICEADGFAAEPGLVQRGYFEDDAVRGEVAKADLDVGEFLERRVDGRDEFIGKGHLGGVG